MKSSELIRLLQSIDPSGETVVCAANCAIYDATVMSAYYDGPLNVIESNENGTPIRGKRVTSGNKIQLEYYGVRECLFLFEGFQIEYESESSRKRYEIHDQIDADENKRGDLDSERQHFAAWVFERIQEQKRIPLAYVDRITKAAEEFFTQNHLGPDSPARAQRRQGSYWDSREDAWYEAFAPEWDNYGRIVIHKREEAKP